MQHGMPWPPDIWLQPQPQMQRQPGSQVSVWGRLFSFGNSGGRSRKPHQSCNSSIGSQPQPYGQLCDCLQMQDQQPSRHDSGSGCVHGMGVCASTVSLQQAVTFGDNLADELAGIHDLYQLPAQPKHEFSCWS
ncbi:hypothetical protein Vretimale_10313 [Volvox reticuliferus]|uniref:Uncharacterized protein n=1 Tax=Volvox reticuliferus TaxID=1737510 RepID=A0A8J4GFD0_9CHLO|nr:hypothetical protein Vretifemale_12336 [Volvox reticuliferus]GIM05944.1 hypothetical protein Vretimale_10313 [Volvox reticuliferus]